MYLLYNIAVWAITGAYFVNNVFYFLSVFWGSFSWLGAGAVLQSLVWVGDAQEGQVCCVMVKDAHRCAAGVQVLPGGTGSPEGPGCSGSLCSINLSSAGQEQGCFHVWCAL